MQSLPKWVVCSRCDCYFECQGSERAPATALPCAHVFCVACLASMRACSPPACFVCSQLIRGQASSINGDGISKDGPAIAAEGRRASSPKVDVKPFKPLPPGAPAADAFAPVKVEIKPTSPGIDNRTMGKAVESWMTKRCCFSCAAEGMTTPATHTCASCDSLFFCTVHGKAHQAVRVHQLRHLRDDGVAGDIELAPVACPTHSGQVCHRFCVSDGKLVCPECCVYDHPTTTHEVQSIDALTEHFVKELTEVLPVIAERGSSAADNSARISDSFAVLEQHAREAIDTIDSVSAELRRELDEAAGAARDQVRQLVSSRQAAFATQHRELSATATQTTALHNVCADALKTNQPQVLAVALQEATSLFGLLRAQTTVFTPTYLQVLPSVANAVAAIRSVFCVSDSPFNAVSCYLCAPGVERADGKVAPPWTVSLYLIRIDGVAVHAKADDIQLTITDTAGTSIGSSTVIMLPGGYVRIAFSVANPAITEAHLSLTVHGYVVHNWIAPLVPLVRCIVWY
jgi:hypothetical protein